MEAIQTKYLSPTNIEDRRIMAWCGRGNVVISHPDGLLGPDAHRFAVTQLVRRFADEDAKQYGVKDSENPWLRPFVTGWLPDGDCCHVFLQVNKPNENENNP